MIKASDLAYPVGALIDIKQAIKKSPFELTNSELLDPDVFGKIGLIGLKYGKYSNHSDIPDDSELQKEYSYKDVDIVIGAFFEWCNIKADDDGKK